MLKKCLNLLKINYAIYFQFGASIPTFKAYHIKNKYVGFPTEDFWSSEYIYSKSLNFLYILLSCMNSPIEKNIHIYAANNRRFKESRKYTWRSFNLTTASSRNNFCAK